jgi:peroxiredoxin Q/BCP
MLKPGDHAPDFELPDSAGRPVRLSGLLREGPVVLAFYPADFTPVCTAQACMMRDRLDGLASLGHRLIAISPQATDSHARFRERFALAQILLSDPERVAIRAFGVLGPFGVTRRATFLIDRDAVIRERALADLRLGPHRRLLDRLIRAEKPGQANARS